jgi:hypothetical protein
MMGDSEDYELYELCLKTLNLDFPTLHSTLDNDILLMLS